MFLNSAAIVSRWLCCIMAFIGSHVAAADAVPTELSGHAAKLFAQAQAEGRWFDEAMALKPEMVPTTNNKSYWVVWRASAAPTKWIVSLHGAGRPANGYATDDLAVWHRHLVGRDVGIACLQWWMGSGDRAEVFYTPKQIYREIDVELSALGVKPGDAMLHGFSRGSANSFAVAAIDAGLGRDYFSLCVASSGRFVPNYPPNQALVEGEYGARPLRGTRWITVAGERDPNPGQSGVQGMRDTAQWLKGQGAAVVLTIEDPASGHGTLHLNPQNCRKVLDEFLDKD